MKLNSVPYFKDDSSYCGSPNRMVLTVDDEPRDFNSKYAVDKWEARPALGPHWIRYPFLVAGFLIGFVSGLLFYFNI